MDLIEFLCLSHPSFEEERRGEEGDVNDEGFLSI